MEPSDEQNWRPVNSASELLRLAGPVLLRNESLNELMLGLLNKIASGQLSSESPQLWTLGDAHQASGAALQVNQERPLLISPVTGSHAAGLARVLAVEGHRPRLILGQPTVLKSFLEVWSTVTATTADLRMKQGLYEATSIVAPPSEGGRLVAAREHHRSTAISMFEGFVSETQGPSERQANDCQGRVDALIAAGNLYFWCDENQAQVSMVGLVRESRTTSSVSLVYTPHELRGRGFASHAVAALSQLCLSQGKRACVLRTDLSNETSNKLYSRLGYVRLGEEHLYALSYECAARA